MSSDTFNLYAPPGFRGLHPDIPVTWYRRHLPHWRQSGATYAVTFRLADALPQSKRQQLKEWRDLWERTHPPPRSEQCWKDYMRQYSRLTEAWMDEGAGECVFRSAKLAKILADALLHFQDERYATFCFAVMPNHCHVVVKPLTEHSLGDILESWKGYVSREVNRELQRQGTLWQQESYDTIIRDEEHLFRVVQYIGNNPAKAGLSPSDWRRWVHPEWEAVGWGFRDLSR